MHKLRVFCSGFLILIGIISNTSTAIPETIMTKSSSTLQYTYSPTLEKCKEMNLDVEKLHVIRSYHHNGDVLVELLGPREDDMDDEDSHCNVNDTNHTVGSVSDSVGGSSSVVAAPVIISVGHGGLYKPKCIANRTKDSHHCTNKGGLTNYCNVTDLYTIDVGLNLVASMMEHYGRRDDDEHDSYSNPPPTKKLDETNTNTTRTGDDRGRTQDRGRGRGYGAVPYLVINHLHRSKIDVNRYKEPGAQDDPIAQGAWQAYHDFIAVAQSKIRQRFGTVRGGDDCNNIEGVVGLLIDIHGYSGNKDWRMTTHSQNSDGSGNGNGNIPTARSESARTTPFIHWGYRLPTSILNQANISGYAHRSTFAFAGSLPDQDLESLIRGPRSLASRFYSLFQDRGHCADEDDEVKNMNMIRDVYCGAGIPSAEFPNPMKVAMDPHWCGIAEEATFTSSSSSELLAKVSTPASCRYFSGGYTTIAHEYLDWQTEPKVGKLRMNTCQMELPRCLRFGFLDGGNGDGTAANHRAKLHADLAHALTFTIHSFLSDLFPSKLVGESDSMVSKMAEMKEA